MSRQLVSSLDTLIPGRMIVMENRSLLNQIGVSDVGARTNDARESMVLLLGIDPAWPVAYIDIDCIAQKSASRAKSVKMSL